MLKEVSQKVRQNIVKSIGAASSGHPGGFLSYTDILVYLYYKEMNLTKEYINSTERNKLVLSKGHGAPALYSVLSSLGFIDEEELLTLRKINSNLQGHPNMNDTVGVDMSTGSLGQGISATVGMTLANKIKHNDYYTFVVCGDGEAEEGEFYEALMSAAHYNLNHLILFIDNNGLQIDGPIDEVISPAPFVSKLDAFGFNTLEIDGHDFIQIEEAVNIAKQSDKPTGIVCQIIKGKGASFMEDQVGWHVKAPNPEQVKQALEELGGE